MAQRQRTVSVRLGAPAERVFAQLGDARTWARMLGLPARVVAGPRGGGVGTVRRVALGPLWFDEEVTYADPPRRLVYRAVAAGPLAYHPYYQGEIVIEPRGDDSDVTWTVSVGSRAPLVAEALARALAPLLHRAVHRLAAELG